MPMHGRAVLLHYLYERQQHYAYEMRASIL